MAQFLVFRLDGLSVALHASSVERVVHAVEISPLPGAPAIALGVIGVAGHVIPVVDMRKRLGLAARELQLSDRIVITRAGQRVLALVVDAVDGVFEYAPASIIRSTDLLADIEQIEGVIQREDGILFIHDLERFLSMQEAVVLAEALAARDEQGSDHAS